MGDEQSFYTKSVGVCADGKELSTPSVHTPTDFV